MPGCHTLVRTMGKLWTWSLLMWPMLLLLFMTQRLLSPTFVESRVSGNSGSSAGAAVASLTWVHALFPYTYRFGGAFVAKAVDILGVRRAGLARAGVCVCVCVCVCVDGGEVLRGRRALRVRALNVCGEWLEEAPLPLWQGRCARLRGGTTTGVCQVCQ